MKNRLGNLLRKLFYKVDIYIRYIPDVNYLYDYLKDKDDLVKFFELKHICSIVALSNDNNYYNEIIKKFVPEWDVNFIKTVFIGSGAGSYNLNTYRQVKFNQDKVYFEKIYFTESIDYQRIFFFYDNIYTHLNDVLDIAKIEYKFENDFMSVIYYDYLKLEQLPKNKIQDCFIEVSKYLYKKSIQSNVVRIIQTAPELFKNYKLLYDYKRYHQDAKNYLKELSINYCSIERKIDVARKIITHSDIKDSNYYQNNILIDWDFFGFFPIGLEVASLYNKLIEYNLQEESPLKWLENNYKIDIKPNEWEIFQLSFSYFLFLFSYGNLYTSGAYDFKLELIELFNKYNN